MAEGDETRNIEIDPDEIAKKVANNLANRGSTPKYSTDSTEAYRYARQAFADTFDLNVSDLTYRVNLLADEFRKESGRWPTGPELYQWDVAQNSVGSYAMGLTQLGPGFDIINDDGTTTTFYNHPIRGTEQAPDVDLEFLKTGVPGGTDRPAYTGEQLSAILSPIRRTRGGSGGGGATRTAQQYDKRELARAVQDYWREELMEEPDDGNVNAIVSGFIKDANAFWVGKAGRLDFQTYLADRVEKTERWGTLYEKKPEHLTTGEYRGQYQQAAGSFGMRNLSTQAEVESGLTSGAGVAGFTERVGRTREARAINQGSYSQRFAQSMASSGLGGT